MAPRIFVVVAGVGALIAGFQNFTYYVPSSMQVTGKLRIHITDDFKNKTSVTTHTITDSTTGVKYRATFSASDLKQLRPGSTVKVSGVINTTASSIAVMSGGVQTLNFGPTVSANFANGGTRKVLIMPINIKYSSGALIELSCTPSQIASKVWGATNSASALYSEMSQGAFSLAGDTTPIITLPSYSINVCDNINSDAWRAAADAEATKAGYNLSAYDYKIYVAPFPSGCSVGGYAALAENWQVALTCDSEHTYAHEMGHSFGMMHAATSGYEYGDSSDIMGVGSDSVSYNKLVQTNGPHKEQMGWTSATSIASGTYTISPLEFAPSSQQVLKFPKPNSNEYFYLSYRQPIGYDVNLKGYYTSGLSIHTLEQSAWKNTFLVSSLSDNQTFSDGNGTSITQLSHNTNGVTVQVALTAGQNCTKAAPTLSLSPSSLTVAPGSTTNVNMQIRNNNSSGCPSASFALYGSGSNQGSNTVNATFTPNPVNLSSGQSATVNIAVSVQGSNFSDTFFGGASQDANYQNRADFNIPVTVTGNYNPPPPTPTPAGACVYNSAPDVWVASGLADPCGAGTCMQCDYNVNRCVSAGRHWCNTGTGQAECWAVYERDGFKQVDGSCGPLKYTWIPTGQLVKTLAAAKTACAGIGRVPTAAELTTDKNTANSSAGRPTLQTFLLNKSPSVNVPSQLHWLDDPNCSNTPGGTCNYYRPFADTISPYQNASNGDGNVDPANANVGYGAYVMCIK